MCLTAEVLETGLGKSGEAVNSILCCMEFYFPLQPPASLYPYLGPKTVLFSDSTCSLCLGMVKRSRDPVPGGRVVTQGSTSSVHRLSINFDFFPLSHPSTSLRLGIPRACSMGHVGLFPFYSSFYSIPFYSILYLKNLS